MSSKPKVLIAMSGGVDSSTTAALLQQGGYDVHGVFMRLGIADIDAQPELDDIENSGDISVAADAQKIADTLNIPLDILDFRAQLKSIIQYFIDEYRRGRTPNPCVQCNRRLKFGALIDHADKIGAQYFATGHYARIAQTPQGSRLCRALDFKKDQSYALFGMGRKNQARVVLPLGEYHKTEVRDLAKKFNLPVHDKAESQEICFIPDDDYARVVAHYAGDLIKPGPVVNSVGETLGQHNGIFQYTIGQRRGLGIALGEPAYVIRLDAKSNTVVLGSRQELHSSTFIAEDIIWLIDPPAEPFRASVQIRYNHRGAAATVTPLDEKTIQVDFDAPITAITPGQAAVLYDPQNHVQAGGWIAS